MCVRDIDVTSISTIFLIYFETVSTDIISYAVMRAGGLAP
jgi:hypothetical protein